MDNRVLRVYQLMIIVAIIWSLSHGHQIAVAITFIVGSFGYYFFYRNSSKQPKVSGDSDILKSNIWNILILMVLVLSIFGSFFYLLSLVDPGFRDSSLIRFVSFVLFVNTAHCIRIGKAKIGRYGGRVFDRDKNPQEYWSAIAISTSVGLILFYISEPLNSVLRIQI